MHSIYLFFTKDNPTFVLILYKRHKNSWRQYKWMIETDELIRGQWISKPLIVKYASLHSTGDYFYYTYYSYVPEKQSCINGVVSRPLNFTALKADPYSSFKCECSSWYTPPDLYHKLFRTDGRHLVLKSAYKYQDRRRLERERHQDYFYSYLYKKPIEISSREEYQWIDPRGRKVMIHFVGKQSRPVIMVDSVPLFDFSMETFEPVEPI